MLRQPLERALLAALILAYLPVLSDCGVNSRPPSPALPTNPPGDPPFFQSDFTTPPPSAFDSYFNTEDVKMTNSPPPGGPSADAGLIHYHICGTPAAPTLSYISAAGSVLPLTTYYVKVTGVGSVGQTGETLPSPEVSLTVPAGSLLQVQLLYQQPDLSGINIYVGKASGSETLQATSVAQAGTWIEPLTGLVTGAPPPTTASTCGSSSQDTNRHFDLQFSSNNGYSNGVSPIYIRAYFYFQAEQPDGVQDPVQRKIFYMWDEDRVTTGTPSWGVALSTFSDNGQIKLTPAIGEQAGTPTVPSKNFWTQYSLHYNTWYKVEFDVVPNSACNSDGSLTLWVNGAQVWQQIGVNIRGCNTTDIGYVEVGLQSNRYDYSPLDEYRYVENVAIGTW
jgi:hypothetical protein